MERHETLRLIDGALPSSPQSSALLLDAGVLARSPRDLAVVRSVEGWSITLDWEHERYVRLYVRDTADLLSVGWEGRVVWYELLRKSDRAGVIDTDDIGILSEMLRLPRDVTETGYARLIERGCIKLGAIQSNGAEHRVTLIPNFLEAQEARQSSAQRARESRARRRDKARTENVTFRDSDVTNRDTSVTLGHTVSHDVTPYRTVPCCTTPSRADSTARVRARDKAPEFDFESVYQLYPRKAGKQKGLEKCRKRIKTEEDFAAFTAAVETMSTLWRGHDTQFCPIFSSFVNQERWKDEELPRPSESPSQRKVEPIRKLERLG